MLPEDKLKKLRHLRQLREQIQLGALSRAKQETKDSAEELDGAKNTYSQLQKMRASQTIKALKAAEGVRDSSARFAGIAITLQRQYHRLGEAKHEIEICEQQLENAHELQAHSKAQFVQSQRNTQKTHRLVDRLVRQRLSREEETENEEIQELFSVTKASTT